MSAITDALNKASAAAAEVAAGPATAGLPATTNGGLPAPGRKLSMSDMQGSLSVDKWIKVKEFGLMIGDVDKLVTKPVRVEFDATEGIGFIPKFAIKYGNPAVYKNSLDGVTTVGGGRWADTVATAQATDPRAQPYRSVDLPFNVTEDIVVDGTVVIEKGKKIGNSTSTTNWREFEQFWREIEVKGLVGKKVLIDLSYRKMTNKNGNVWGILTFALIGEVPAAA